MQQGSERNEVGREPWMRGTHGELDPLRRAVVHALEQALEDAERWCAPLSEALLFARPLQLPPVGFQLRHIARSSDRLLTYAEDRGLGEAQLAQLETEMADGTKAEVLAEYRERVREAMQRVWAIKPETYGAVRGIGRKRLPTTVGGLLVHCAEHTQRHVGQMVTTVKVVETLSAAGGMGQIWVAARESKG